MGKYDKDNRTVVFDIDGVIASAPERGGHEKDVWLFVEFSGLTRLRHYGFGL